MKDQSAKPTPIDLDELIAEKLSQRTRANIELVTIEVSDVAGSGFWLKINKKLIKIHVSVEISTKKLVSWLGGLVTIIGTTVAFLNWFVPILINHFSKSPP